MSDGKDDQNLGRGSRAGDGALGRNGSDCPECGAPLASDQRYCLDCGARRGLLPGAVVGTIAGVSAKGRGMAAAAIGRRPSSAAEDGRAWSWMPSPPAIAIAVIGMLALGVGLGSAMSEVAASAPISTILLEYPHHASEAPPPEEESEEEAEEAVEAPAEESPALAEAPEATAPVEEVGPLPEEATEEPLPPEGGEEEDLEGQPPPVEFNPEEEGPNFLEEEEKEGKEKALPEVKHAFLIVLGEGGYDATFGAAAGAPYLSRVLPKKGELLPDYYGVTSGVLANEIALLSGQGPTPETAADCPDYTAITPGTVSPIAEQVEGNGCVYDQSVESLPTQLAAKELKWRAYVEDIEKGPEVGQPASCRKPGLGGPDSSPIPAPGDQYTTWRNPVVYFSAIAEDAECGKLDVGFEALTRDLKSEKKTPALSLIFPDACHSGAELECEPGAPTGANGVVALLKTLVPAIMASPAYQEGGLIMITSAQAPQTNEAPDPSACCLAPQYPNLAPVTATPAGTTTTPTTGATTTPSGTTTSKSTTTEAETTTVPTTRYTEESVLESGGGGKVGLLLISPFVEPGKVEETEYANHFTLLKTLETMFGVEPLGYASEEEVPTLSPELFLAGEEAAEDEGEPAAPAPGKGKKSSGEFFRLDRALGRLLRSADEPRVE